MIQESPSVYEWIVLLTDYGGRDGFAGICHGVIARIAPQVRVIDLSHEVTRSDVRHGAAVLAQAIAYLPPAVVVGVVDPGVGTDRRALAITAGESVLVGPDNGLLMWAADALGGATRAAELVSPLYRLETTSATFHGRDVFAPVAAHLATGVGLTDLGPLVSVGDVTRLPPLRHAVSDGVIDTEVLTVDHFGNVQLAARARDLEAAGFDSGRVRIAAGTGADAELAPTFAAVSPGGLLLYVDSAGQAALAVRDGDAARVLGLAPGNEVTLIRAR